MNFKNHRNERDSDSHAEEARRRECARLEAALTAYFDGEATARERRAAIAHLKRCEACALTWRDWNDARYIWRQAPVALPPVGLLTRVLMACRLSALTRRPNSPLMRPYVAVPDRTQSTLPVAESLVPELLRSMPAVEAPDDLQRAILQRTTHREIDPPSDSIDSRRPFFATRVLSGLRTATALTVPATLLWVAWSNIDSVTQAPFSSPVITQKLTIMGATTRISPAPPSAQIRKAAVGSTIRNPAKTHESPAAIKAQIQRRVAAVMPIGAVATLRREILERRRVAALQNPSVRELRIRNIPVSSDSPRPRNFAASAENARARRTISRDVIPRPVESETARLAFASLSATQPQLGQTARF